MKKKIVYIAPHLSTGGMPQYLYKQIEVLQEEFEIYCIEWGDVTGGVLVVQRNKIKSLLGDRLLTIGEHKEELFEMIKRINPDVVHLQEIPELFMVHSIAEKLYAKDRKYSIIETSHDSSQIAENKRFFPDKFLFVSQYQLKQYQELGIPSDVVEYPIEYFNRTKTREEAQKYLGMNPNLKHIINVGLFTPRKNQAEIVEYAKALKDYPVQFHFIGNHADNFKYYWEPLIKDWPENCKWWNERTDVENFYQAADLFLFTSRGSNHDKETMPLVIREAISWQVPSLIYNLPVYENYFDKYPNIKYLNFLDKEKNKSLIIENIFSMTELQSNSRLQDLLKEIRMSYGGINTDKADGANELYGLYDLIKKHTNSDSVVMEIGAFEGKSTELFALNCKKVYSVDSYHPYPDIHPDSLIQAENIFLQMQSKYTNIEKIKKFSLDASKDFENNTFDLIYIDAAHDYESVKSDILAWLPKVKLGGVISGHDFTSIPSVKQAVMDIFTDEKIYTFADSSWAVVLNNYESNYWKVKSRWDNFAQTIYYGCGETINFPIVVSLKEYKSDAVMWTTSYEYMPKNIEFWMLPVYKEFHDYSQDDKFTGVKLCIYDKKTNQQIYEEPHFVKFVNIPTISASNQIPYYNNYIEFFIDRKYSNLLDKKYTNVVDVGANVGIFSFFLLKNKMTDKIVCVECDKKALIDLHRNYEFNHNVKIIPKALHHTNTQITFYHSPDNPVISSTISPEKLENHMAGIKGDVECKVDTITIKDIIDDIGTIDLLKIDIEGGEYNIFENLDTELFQYINNIFIECHFFERDYKQKYANLLNTLTNNGYLVKEFTEGQSNNAGTSEVIYAKKIK